MDAWSCKTLKICEQFLLFLETPITVKFSKFCSESFHRDTDWRVVFKFREIWPTENRWNRALFTTQKTILSAFQTVDTAQIDPKICQGQLLRICSRCQRNRFTFGRVIAERVNTAKTRGKVNPIFGWSLASSRITNELNCLTLFTSASHNALKYFFYPVHKAVTI